MRRRSFFLYSLLIILLVVVFLLLLLLLIGVGELLLGGDVQVALDSFGNELVKSASPLSMAINLTISATLIFAQLNIAAKRLRDMGLPGWWVVGAVGIIALIFNATLSDQTASGLNAAAWLALLLVPSGVFNRATQDEPAAAPEKGKDEG